MVSTLVGSKTELGKWIATAENALAGAGVGYVGKIAYDNASAWLSGHSYVAAANLSSFAYGAGVLALANVTAKFALDYFFGEEKSVEQTVNRAILAVQLTTLALIPLNVTLAVKGILVLFPALFIGEKLADKVRAAIA